jgi:hypothetical protein
MNPEGAPLSGDAVAFGGLNDEYIAFALSTGGPAAGKNNIEVYKRENGIFTQLTNLPNQPNIFSGTRVI